MANKLTIWLHAKGIVADLNRDENADLKEALQKTGRLLPRLIMMPDATFRTIDWRNLYDMTDAQVDRLHRLCAPWRWKPGEIADVLMEIYFQLNREEQATPPPSGG